jgi:hypothetical protein
MLEKVGACFIGKWCGQKATTLYYLIIKELFEGKPLEEKDLKEMLGHTPLEVTGGILVGILTALFVWLVWPK